MLYIAGAVIFVLMLLAAYVVGLNHGTDEDDLVDEFKHGYKEGYKDGEMDGMCAAIEQEAITKASGR